MLWMPLLFNFDETRNKIVFVPTFFGDRACFKRVHVLCACVFAPRSRVSGKSRQDQINFVQTKQLFQSPLVIGFEVLAFSEDYSAFILPFHTSIHLAHTRDIAISKCSLINTIISIPCIFKLVMKNTLVRIVRGLKLEAYELAGIVSSRLPTYGSTYQSTLPAQLLYCFGS